MAENVAYVTAQEEPILSAAQKRAILIAIWTYVSSVAAISAAFLVQWAADGFTVHEIVQALISGVVFSLVPGGVAGYIRRNVEGKRDEERAMPVGVTPAGLTATAQVPVTSA